MISFFFKFRLCGRKFFLNFFNVFFRIFDGIIEICEMYVLLFFGNLDFCVIIYGYVVFIIKGEWNLVELKVIFSVV